jgi:hypothetical protein
LRRPRLSIYEVAAPDEEKEDCPLNTTPTFCTPAEKGLKFLQF